MKKFLCGVCALLSLPALAQDTLPEKNLNEVIIYTGKFAERRKNIAQPVQLISSRRIAEINAQNTGDLLLNTGNVFVQKSQQGGSSPVIRGFEASRVLLVVDGIRMNNAIYRSGHLQNVITVDQNMLERVEVLYGPGSTLYGSDALGGVVLFRTKQPRLSATDHLAASGSALVRYSSANNERTGHADASIGGRRLAWLQSYNYSDFGHLRMGDNYPDKYPDFSRRSRYVTRINGIDSVVANPDDRIQKFSGYQQWDITQKLLYRPNERVTHGINLQYSNSSNVPRYDRLQDIRNGTLRFAEWYYGPQLRELAAYEFNLERLGFLDRIRAIASYQHIEESRHQRDYRRYDRLDNRMEDLDVWALNLDGQKHWGNHELTLGADLQLNDLESTGIRRNTNTGAETKLDSRYPNGDNDMNYFGVYAQHLFKFGNGRWVLNDGLRLQATSLRSTIADNSFFNFPFTTIEQETKAATGNIGLIYLGADSLRVHGSVASGFRAPNIDDMARIFESNTASRQLILPNPDLKPEYTYTFDLGASYYLGSRVRLEASLFYTFFRNAIALAPYRYNGQDSILYNGVMSAAFANRNVNKAHLYGANAQVSVDFSRQLQLFSTINYTYGRLNPGKVNEVPLDHIPPVFGRTALTFTNKRLTAEAYALYNGWKKIRDYNPSGEDNAQYATPEGTPSWWTLNIKASLRLHPLFTLQAGVENLLDRNYRYFASGFSAPGRNVLLALRASF